MNAVYLAVMAVMIMAVWSSPVIDENDLTDKVSSCAAFYGATGLNTVSIIITYMVIYPPRYLKLKRKEKRSKGL